MIHIAKATVASNGAMDMECCCYSPYWRTSDSFTTNYSNQNMVLQLIELLWDQRAKHWPHCYKTSNSEFIRIHFNRLNNFWNKKNSSNRFVASAIVLLLLVVFGVYFYFDTIGSRERIRSLMGIFILYGFGYVFSTNRSKVDTFI